MINQFATPHGEGLRREAVTKANGNVRMGEIATTFLEVLHGDQKRKASLPVVRRVHEDEWFKACDRAFFSPSWRQPDPAVIADFPLEGTY